MGLEQVASKTAARIDYDTYRLRTFVEALGETELERRSDTTKLSAVAGALEANPKAVLFNAAGAGSHPLVGNALASRSRFAKGFGADQPSAARSTTA
jgi:3-polyprenyl-4-hydroxybenzoate decarboxylase